MNLRPLFLILLALSLSVSASAQTVTASAPAVPKASSASIAPSQRQAADVLIGSIYTAASFNQLIDQFLDAQLKTHQEIKPYEPEMRAFLTKYMGFEVIRPALAEAYAQKFTEAELRELTKFYQSPVGKKMAALLPEMMQTGGEIGQRLVKEHLPELQEAIAAKTSGTK